MVYRFYCMALFHSQTRRHMINCTNLLSFLVFLFLLSLILWGGCWWFCFFFCCHGNGSLLYDYWFLFNWRFSSFIFLLLFLVFLSNCVPASIIYIFKKIIYKERLTLSLLALTFCRLLITFANSLGQDQD